MDAAAEQRFNSADYDDPMVARILDAAEKCIHRYGIRRTPIGEVARVAGCSRASVYRYFSDKDALVAGVFNRRRVLMLNRTEAALAEERTLVDKVTYSVVHGRADKEEGIFASLAETEPETVSMMLLDSANYERSVAFWPPHIRQAQAEGEINPEIDVGMATDFIMRLAVTLVLFPHLGVELKSREEVRAYIEQVLIRGLGPDPELEKE